MQLKIIKNKEDLNFFRTKSELVDFEKDNVKELSNGLLEGLYKHNAIGVAGTMFGIHKRIVVVDLQEHGHKKPLILINPEIIEYSENTIPSEEASISILKIRETISRYETIKLKYFNISGEECELKASGLLSRCIQHEMDYLDGKLFFDYLSENRKQEIENIITSLDTGMKLTYVIKDEEILRKKSEKVEVVDEEIVNTLDKMLEFMYQSKGIGLAAVQVGILKRMVTIDLQENNKNNPLFLINPEIIWHSDNMVDSEEGCLSVPQQRAKIKRFEKVKVKHLDKEGKENIIDADGLLAICLQHELDHLDGKLYIDYLSKLKRDLLLNKVKGILKKM